MNLTLEIGNLTPTQVQQIMAIAKGDAPSTAATRETKVTRAPSTKGKTKTKAALAADDADDLLDEGVDAEEVEAVEEDEELVEDEEAEELDEDLSDDEGGGEVTKVEVTAAFKKYMKNFKVKGKVDVAAGRKAAIAILKKVKAKSVDEIKPKDYSKVMELIEG